MLRLLGVILLGTGSTAMGLCAAKQLTGKVTELKGLICGLSFMQRGLASSAENLGSMLQSAAENTVGSAQKFFSAVYDNLRHSEGAPFFRCWNDALEETLTYSGEKEKGYLRPLGNVLGCYDGDSQLSALERAIDQLGATLKEADESRKSKSKVYLTLGASAGLLLSILLL